MTQLLRAGAYEEDRRNGRHTTSICAQLGDDKIAPVIRCAQCFLRGNVVDNHMILLEYIAV